MTLASVPGMPISALDSSGPSLFLQIGGVALVGATVGFVLALVDRWSVKRTEHLENEQRHGQRRGRRSARHPGLLAGTNRLHEKNHDGFDGRPVLGLVAGAGDTDERREITISIGDRPYYTHGPYYVESGVRWVWVPGHWAKKHHKKVWIHGHYARR